MTTIYKYPFGIADPVHITMPQGAKVLALQLQNGVPCLWAQVVPSNTPRDRTLRIFGTGLPIATDKLTYVGTFQIAAFVWHVYISDEGGFPNA